MLLGALIGGIVGLVVVLIKNAKQKNQDKANSDILDNNSDI